MHNLPPPERYRVLGAAEQEALCQEILAEVASGQFKPVGEGNQQHWDDVWSRSYSNVPSYVKPAAVLRVAGQFVRPKDPTIERFWYERCREKLLKTYFKDVPAIYEFGCGNGWNLHAARALYPLKELVGLDWSQSAVDRLPRSIQGRVFDFFKPDYDVVLPPGSGVLTVGALEQTGTRWEPFLEYLLDQRPACCLHVEPILEWYDPENPVDQTAIAYHRARKYWEAFPAELAHLASQGKAEIIHQQRSFFGSKYIEGYSLLVWRPT